MTVKAKLQTQINYNIRASRNAAQRNKPTMWAYHLKMARHLKALRSGTPAQVERRVRNTERINRETAPTSPPELAATLWALSIYLRLALDIKSAPRGSLDWLHTRGENVEAEL